MKYESWHISSAILIVSFFLAVGGCGNDGGTGVDPATVNNLQAQIDELSEDYVDPESCSVCHSGVGEEEHQAIYDEYADSSFELFVDSTSSVDNLDGTFDVTVTFTIEKYGLPYFDTDELPTLEQMRVYAVLYDSVTGTFDYDHRLSRGGAGVIALGGGQYSVTSTMDYAPELTDSEVYLYIGDGPLDTEGMTLYADVANAGMAYGDLDPTDPDTYVSAANPEGCELCHGMPYLKHGYRAAEVDGLPDFAACKVCHYDTRNGRHEDWQILVDDPERYAEVHAGDDLTPAEEIKYAYTANIMNDVHMSHAMEFPYPQSMATCNTCHEDKLDMILTDTHFVTETCKSCHPVTGPPEGTSPKRAPAMETLWADAGVAWHDIDSLCNGCHFDGNTFGAETFDEKHTGYDKHIYSDAAGTRYSDVFTVSIDDADLVDNTLTINFSATETGDIPGLAVTDIIPTVMVGLYGWDSKDYIVGPHERDADRNRLLEFPVDGTTVNPRFTVVTAAGGFWEVTADLTMWADMIADGTVKRAEIAVMPMLADIVGEIDSRSNGETDDTAYAVIAPSRTFDLLVNAFDDDYFDPIVRAETGCNDCHDALATTFHSPNRGGNVVVCRMCHITRAPGSHLEMQSRSIDSYVHAIHSFQAFDSGDVDFTDPVEAVMYELHIEHTYPNFTIKNCESCHNEGTFEAPDQSKSMPGLLSKSDTWNVDRNIGDVPEYVSGPASRACGGCHRADLINEDAAGELAAWNQHTADFGYLVENDDEDLTLESVIEEIMSMFD